MSNNAHNDAFMRTVAPDVSGGRPHDELHAELVELLDHGVFLCENACPNGSGRVTGFSRFGGILGEPRSISTGAELQNEKLYGVYVGPKGDQVGLATFLLSNVPHGETKDDVVASIKRIKAQGILCEKPVQRNGASQGAETLAKATAVTIE